MRVLDVPTKGLLRLVAALVVMAAVAATVLTVPATAQVQTVWVRLASGEIVAVTVAVPPGGTVDDVELPGELVPAPPAPETTTPEPPAPPEPHPPSDPPPPSASPPLDAPTAPPPPSQERSSSGKRVQERTGQSIGLTGGPDSQVELEAREVRRRISGTPLRNPDGTPTASNPGFVDALPGPSTATGVPNFIIRKFRVPPFLLPIYQAAGVEYGVRWEILAAINEIETDYGRNLSVSSAGAVGWMQFMPSTWRTYGVDANKDGRKDPYNPVDAIFAAARYLHAAGYETDVRGALFAYNHADWYVDSVLLRARLIAGVPADLIGSLTGLTEARFPVQAPARYAGDVTEQALIKRVARGEDASNLIESSNERRSVDIYADEGAPVVAVNDGVIKKVGRNTKLGRHIVLQDAYGNRYTYAHLGQISKLYAVPEDGEADDPERGAETARGQEDPKPDQPASAGRQLERSAAPRLEGSAARAAAPRKSRLFAHPYAPGARRAGGLEQRLEAEARLSGRFEIFKNYFSRPLGLGPDKARLRPLRQGSRVIGGTLLARVGRTVPGTAAHVDFSIRPAGRGAPRIDPKPILDGWKLLEATAIYRAKGKNVLREGPSIGQILLLSKPLLQRRVLADERIEIYPCGRADIRAGQVDRRILATLAYLAASGLRPTVTSLRCGHSYHTKSGNVSHHSSGNAVDIAKVNGVPVLGHQEPGGIVDQTVRRLMQLQGNFAPAQVISLFEIGGPTVAMADHADHIHVGFSPAGGDRGGGSAPVLKPWQWPRLLDRLREIPNPVVEATPRRP